MNLCLVSASARKECEVIEVEGFHAERALKIIMGQRL